jgi:2',3'-cyclic-nucleotide 2'-phosphodiesterase (5'-nucleotidase family)
MKALKICAWVGISLLILLTSACLLGNVTITILQTSDIHHHASGYGPFLDYTPLNTADHDTVLGGYARLATLINNIRQEQAAKQIPVLLFDSGDFFMGTVYDLTAYDPKGPAALKFFTQMKYDAVTPGNHEFEWSASGLALLLGNGISKGGFNVPVVASNMVTPSSNPLQALIGAGVIMNKKVIQFPYGLKVGVLGLMGPNADSEAPAAAPVTFNHDYSFIQQMVNTLRNNDCVQLVVALSHGGIRLDGTGDDADLAKNVSGIDVIASGHYHTATQSAFVMGPSNTIIFSPGEYGEYLSRIDITYNVFLGKIVDHKFTLIPVNDTIQGDAAMEGIVDAYQGDINASLAPLGVSLTSPISKTSSPLELTDLLPPYGTGESSLGELAADSLRAVANSLTPLNGGKAFDFSVVENGVVRDYLYPGTITFADIYDALPLGISPDTSQPVPGYPLMSIYVTGTDLRTICEAGLTLGPTLGSDYYLNFSGLNIGYNPNNAPILQGVSSVATYAPTDPLCQGSTTPVDPNKLYHGVVDLYALEMMGVVTARLAGTGLEIIPRDVNGNEINPAAYMNYRIDSSIASGIQELKAWMALESFLGMVFPYPVGDPGSFYGSSGRGRITIQ